MPIPAMPPRTWKMTLLTIRLSLRLSLRQAARVADMSHMQVHLLEKGEGTPAARKQLLDAYRRLSLHYERTYEKLAGTCAELANEHRTPKP
ncbi:MAG TPA: hypothetical protein VFU76_07190 [Terriglobales bacterium]|nr:hypothetical protein [Terriglobales bacterium]